jgi:DNA-binding Lrp family transcriptional regulator
LQDLQKKILEILEEDDRTTPEEIATMLGVTIEEVKQLIKQFEDNKTIVKYHALVNWEKTDTDLVEALIEVQVTPEREFGFDTIAERIYRFPEVRSVFLMSGGYDLTVLVWGRSMKEVAYFVATKLSTLEQVQSTATHFILKKYKQEGVILEDKDVNQRLVVSP